MPHSVLLFGCFASLRLLTRMPYFSLKIISFEYHFSFLQLLTFLFLVMQCFCSSYKRLSIHHLCRGTSAISYDIFLFCLRLVDELTTLHKEAALKIAREEIRAHILQILILLQQLIICSLLFFQIFVHRDTNISYLA